MIKYYVPEEAMVEIKTHDVLGNEISELLNESKVPGLYHIYFNGNNLISGIYINKIVAQK
jgi:hypothetical protein